MRPTAEQQPQGWISSRFTGIEGQLSALRDSLSTQFEKINLRLNELDRQDNLSTAERSNIDYRVTEAEKAIHALEQRPNQQQQSFFQAAGCSINALYLIISAGSLLGTIAAVTVSVVALILR